jgi:hypothetical protein
MNVVLHGLAFRTLLFEAAKAPFAIQAVTITPRIREGSNIQLTDTCTGLQQGVRTPMGLFKLNKGQMTAVQEGGKTAFHPQPVL